MKYPYSKRSLDNLATCTSNLQRLFLEMANHRNTTIVEGHRGQEKQHKYFIEGKSKLDWPHGNHNSLPSKAVDAVPAEIDWALVNKSDRASINEIYMFVGEVIGISKMMEINIRVGADWDGDGDIDDQKFHDLPHFEEVQEK
jgi:peptidoglycan L-alanyl-D-glutamate endopeptidase CwlK